jgi:myb proto-oncogene protein
MHGGKNWVAIATLVPNRTKIQCESRWGYRALAPSIALTGGSTGKWKDVEDMKLKAAVQTHGDKNWVEVAALVPGRTGKECYDRWKYGRYS